MIDWNNRLLNSRADYWDVPTIANRVPRLQSGLMEHLTPKQIVAELDKYIVGQNDAKRAVALRNGWRRQPLAEEVRQNAAPKDILRVSTTGVGGVP